MKDILNSDLGIKLRKKLLIWLMITAITSLLPFLPKSEGKKLLTASINYASASIYAVMIVIFILRNLFKTFINNKQYKNLTFLIVFTFLFLFEFSELISHRGILPVIVGLCSYILILVTLLIFIPLLILFDVFFDFLFREKILIPWIKIEKFSDFFASIFTICIMIISISILYFSSKSESIFAGYCVISMYEIFCDILSYFHRKEFCKNKL